MRLIPKCILTGTAFLLSGFSWGFFAHRQINQLAVFTLPPEMISFYKRNIQYLTDAACDPDRRRYAVEDEAPRHYIDMDRYEADQVPIHWSEAVTRYTEDTLLARGIVPWHVAEMQRRLRNAFLLNDPKQILRLSAELGHYVADAHVPLHTTSNYNGQQTGQTGLHAFWETRLPELFFEEYDFLVGKASYIRDVPAAVWQHVIEAHREVDSVLQIEQRLYKASRGKKYGFETRGKVTVKLESIPYATAYHQALNGMVERQMRSSVKMIGDLWYTAWVDAGQPDLKKWLDYTPTEEELEQRKLQLEQWKSKAFLSRDHESDH